MTTDYIIDSYEGEEPQYSRIYMVMRTMMVVGGWS